MRRSSARSELFELHDTHDRKGNDVMRSRLVFSSLLCLAIACGGEPEPVEDVGHSPWPDAPELHKGAAMCPPGDDYEPKVDWEGYVENGTDPVTADRVRIRMPQGETPGFVLFGSGPELPAPRANEVYACVDPQGPWVAGHRYEMLETTLGDRRLQFKLDQQEPFRAWCEIQDPDGPCGHLKPFFSEDCRDARGRQIDCEVMLLCMKCACDSSCHASSELGGGWLDSHAYARIDLTVDGDRAQGSAGGLDRNATQLRLYAAD